MTKFSIEELHAMVMATPAMVALTELYENDDYELCGGIKALDEKFVNTYNDIEESILEASK